MLEFVANVQTEDANLKKVFAAIKELKSFEVLVGVPEEESSRPPSEEDKGSAATNAELLYIHTNGSPVNNIPPRPVIEPAIVDSKETIAESLKQASIKAMNGDAEGMKQGLEKAGLYGENAAKGWFTNPKNGWAPNNEITKNLKGSSKPLIDTGEMRKSITHVVRKK